MNIPTGNTGLPPGTTQRDCDGKPDPIGEMTDDELWESLDSELRWAIQDRFWVDSAEELSEIYFHTAHDSHGACPQNSASIALLQHRSHQRLWDAYRWAIALSKVLLTQHRSHQRLWDAYRAAELRKVRR